jgi:hypothetical protein
MSGLWCQINGIFRSQVNYYVSAQNLKEWHGYLFLLCPSNRAPCYVVSKLGNSLSALSLSRASRSNDSRSKDNVALESFVPTIVPNFEATTKLKLYL